MKKDYTKLPICILGDSLYACKRVFDICKENKWRYILKFKEGSIPIIAEEFNILKKNDSVEGKGFNFVNEIYYDDKKVNVAEYIEVVKVKNKLV